MGDGAQLVAETGKSLRAHRRQGAPRSTPWSLTSRPAPRSRRRALQQVSNAVTEMDKVTQQNAAMAEAATAASRSLAQEAEQLSSLAGQFRLTNVVQFELERRRRRGPSKRPGPARCACA